MRQPQQPPKRKQNETSTHDRSQQRLPQHCIHRIPMVIGSIPLPLPVLSVEAEAEGKEKVVVVEKVEEKAKARGKVKVKAKVKARPLERHPQRQVQTRRVHSHRVH